MLSSLSNKTEVPATLAPARKKAVIDAAVALHAARDETASARQALAEETAALAAVEREIAEMPHPGVDDDAIEACDARKRKLAVKAGGYRLRVDEAQKRLCACENLVREAQASVLKTLAERDAPAPTPIDQAADLPALKAKAASAREEAEKAESHVERLQAQAAPVLAAFEGLKESGATRDLATQLLEESDAMRDKLATARREKVSRAEAARAAESRLLALQERLQGEADREAFGKALAFLEARRPVFEPAIAAYSAAGEQMASLFATCHVWLRALDAQDRYGSGYEERYGKAFMLAPKFADAARVPILGGEGHFVSSHWKHRYEDFALRQDILAPLKKLIVRDANLGELLQSGAKIFAQEYERIALQLLTSLAPMCSWVVDRDAVFDTVGDLAREVVRPELPIQWRGGEDRPWRRLSLPSLRANADPIWASDRSPGYLLDLAKRAEAA